MFIRRKTYDELRDRCAELRGRNGAQAEDIRRHIYMIERMRAELRDVTNNKITDLIAELGDMTEARDDLRAANRAQAEKADKLCFTTSQRSAIAMRFPLAEMTVLRAASRVTNPKHRYCARVCLNDHFHKTVVEYGATAYEACENAVEAAAQHHNTRALDLFKKEDADTFCEGVRQVAEEMKAERKAVKKAQEDPRIKAAEATFRADYPETAINYRMVPDSEGQMLYRCTISEHATSTVRVQRDEANLLKAQASAFGAYRDKHPKHVHAYMGMPSMCLCGEPNPDAQKPKEPAPTEAEKWNDDLKAAGLRFQQLLQDAERADPAARGALNWVVTSTKGKDSVVCTIRDERLSDTDDYQVDATAPSADTAMLFAIALYQDRPAKLLELDRLKKEMGL